MHSSSNAFYEREVVYRLRLADEARLGLYYNFEVLDIFNMSRQVASAVFSEVLGVGLSAYFTSAER
jgi:hypothetical protein